MQVVVAYDICDNRRRARIFKTMKGYGRRVQYSVFECGLDSARLQKMLTEVRKQMKVSEDSLRVYLLCAECCGKAIIEGISPPFGTPECFIA